MPLEPIKIARAMADGLSAVCASCVLYWEARDKGLPGHQCLARDRCGSPLAGDVFHEYDGPLLGALQHFCFVCGTKAAFLARVSPKPRGIGVCAAHVTLFDTLQANGRRIDPVPPPVVLGPDGNPIPGPKPRRKTLLESVHEVESFYEERARDREAG